MNSDKALIQTVLYLHFRLERAQRQQSKAISLSQYRLLYMIQNGPARSVELATASGMAKPSIGALVNQLEENLWIKRKKVSGDKRAASISITAAGKKVIEKFHQNMQTELESFLGTEAVAKADDELDWLFDVLQQKRQQAHDNWAQQKLTDKISVRKQ